MAYWDRKKAWIELYHSYEWPKCSLGNFLSRMYKWHISVQEALTPWLRKKKWTAVSEYWHNYEWPKCKITTFSVRVYNYFIPYEIAILPIWDPVYVEYTRSRRKQPNIKPWIDIFRPQKKTIKTENYWCCPCSTDEETNVLIETYEYMIHELECRDELTDEEEAKLEQLKKELEELSPKHRG